MKPETREELAPAGMPPFNPFLMGNFAPVATECTALDLPVTGSIPKELEGRYLRMNSNPVEPVDPKSYYWSTGTGMVHGIRLRDGRAEWYRNRFIRGDRVTRAKGWPETPGPRFGADDNCNTNVIGLAGRTYACIEGGARPMTLSYELETVRRSDFDGTLPGAFSGHPHKDAATGETLAICFSPAVDFVQYVCVGANGRVKKTVNVPTPGKTMIHDMAFTTKYALILDAPVLYSPRLALAGQPLPYEWVEGYGHRVGLLPRSGGADDVIWCEAPLGYVTHVMNAYDTPDGQVVMHCVRYPKMFSAADGGSISTPQWERWTIDARTRRVRHEKLHDRGHEFPRFDERRAGLPYRWGYTGIMEGPIGVDPGNPFKHDFDTGRVVEHDLGRGRVTMEPCFVPRDADAAEDDGWVMFVTYNANNDRSELVILNAQDFSGEPQAVIHLPQRVPFGFHGNWVPDSV